MDSINKFYSFDSAEDIYNLSINFKNGNTRLSEHNASIIKIW